MRKMQLPDYDDDDDNCAKKGEIEIGNGNGSGSGSKTSKAEQQRVAGEGWMDMGVGQLIKANLSDARKYATHEPQRQ